ncbi:MAG: hypothetical protein KF830_08275 [Planctomycetes bacterium]|nr:hypothetical protein [Planctomycetota bacterium]
MFAWLRRRRHAAHRRRLELQHRRLLQEARDWQRRGDIRGFAERVAAADAVERELARLEAATGDARRA